MKKYFHVIKLCGISLAALACITNACAEPRTGGGAASLYNKGIKCAQNNQLKKAADLYKQAANKGYAPAQNNLGLCYAYGNGVERNAAEAVRWFRKAAKKGYDEAQCNLAKCYTQGNGVEPNAVEAVRWFRMSAEQGNAMAQYFLGIHYAQGNGVEQNVAEAERWYRKSASQGHVGAQQALKKLR